ncbi:TauD/TfdA family dioxygenase, partial [Peribacillus sp. NPDC097198]|uniref:TauD/TfdA family dioxygenase n=1 Tax=Peribacillus sp. NPDC097198 TaxID=3364397 RepID=UPI0037F35833
MDVTIKKLTHENIYTKKYSNKDINIVKVYDIFNASTLNQLIHDYSNNGFAIFELMDMEVNQETLKQFTDSLGLGAAYIPSTYNNKSFYSKKGFNLITKNKHDQSHKAFNTSSEQELHSDGTLEPIGFIKTSLLFCESQGLSGGENTLFNSVGAFYDMLINCSNIGWSMLNDSSLRRYSYINNDQNIGPTFSIKENQIISRFSLDNTSDWNYGFENVPNLEKAYSFLQGLIYEG